MGVAVHDADDFEVRALRHRDPPAGGRADRSRRPSTTPRRSGTDRTGRPARRARPAARTPRAGNRRARDRRARGRRVSGRRSIGTGQYPADGRRRRRRDRPTATLAATPRSRALFRRATPPRSSAAIASARRCAPRGGVTLRQHEPEHGAPSCGHRDVHEQRRSTTPGRSRRPGSSVAAARAASSGGRPVSTRVRRRGHAAHDRRDRAGERDLVEGSRASALSWLGHAAARNQDDRHQPSGAARLRGPRDDRVRHRAEGLRGEVAARRARAVRRRQRLDPRRRAVARRTAHRAVQPRVRRVRPRARPRPQAARPPRRDRPAARRVDQERLALVPLALYFKNGRAKVELGARHEAAASTTSASSSPSATPISRPVGRWRRRPGTRVAAEARGPESRCRSPPGR